MNTFVISISFSISSAFTTDPPLLEIFAFSKEGGICKLKKFFRGLRPRTPVFNYIIQYIHLKNDYICNIKLKGWCLASGQLLASEWEARSRHKWHSSKKSSAAAAQLWCCERHQCRVLSSVASAISVKHLRLLGHHCHCSAITLILLPKPKPPWPSTTARPPW